VALHISDLGENSQDDLAHASADRAKAVNIDGHASIDQPPHRRLDIKGIAPKSIHGVDAQRVAFSDLLEKSAEIRPSRSHSSAAHTFILKLAIKLTAHCVTLSVDALASSGNPIVGNAHGWLIS